MQFEPPIILRGKIYLQFGGHNRL